MRSRQVVIACLCAAAVLYALGAPRPRGLPLATSVDGPALDRAAGVVFLLHGRGGGLLRAHWMIGALRDAGLPSDVAIVLVEAPFSSWPGHAWGDTAKQQAESRARVRALFDTMLAKDAPASSHLVLAGYSQGAGIALDVAAEDTRVGAVASFSPCWLWLRGELPKRTGLRVLLAHGNRDPTCPVNESRTLARVLETAKVPVRYLEFDGKHEVPPDVMHALAELAKPR